MQLLRSGPPCRAGSFTVHFNSLSIASDLIGCPCRAKRDRQAAPVWHIHAFFPRPSGARLPLKGNQKKFSTPPSENPAPPDFRLPGRRCAASATATQRPPAIFNARNSTNPFDVLGCTRLSVQVRQRRFSPCSNGRQDHGFFSGTAKARTKTAYYNVVGIQ